MFLEEMKSYLPLSVLKSTLQIMVPPKQYPLAHCFFDATVFASSYPIHWSSHVICFIIESFRSLGVRLLVLGVARVSKDDLTREATQDPRTVFPKNSDG